MTTNYEQWLNRQSPEFHQGLDAAAIGEERDRSKSHDWKQGYDHFKAQEIRSERARYA